MERLLDTINLALNGQYASIDYNDHEWHQEFGLLYVGIIQDDMTFDLFLEDHYEETLKIYPLSDIKEIFSSLLEFMNNDENINSAFPSL